MVLEVKESLTRMALVLACQAPNREEEEEEDDSLDELLTYSLLYEMTH